MGAWIKGAGRQGRPYLIVQPDGMWLVASLRCTHNHHDDGAAAECAEEQGAVAWPRSLDVPAVLERAGSDRMADRPNLGAEILTAARSDHSPEQRPALP